MHGMPEAKVTKPLPAALQKEADALRKDWETNPRWKGITRPYSAEDVIRLRPAILEANTLADVGSRRLWDLITETPYVNSLGCLTGTMAMQMVKAGMKAIYCSGWQVAADANLSSNTYPDQSLYPSNSVPHLVRRINNALTRADQIERSEGNFDGIHWHAPIVADAEAGFGGPLHAYELMKSMIEAGASGVHFEDQLAAEKKCGHLGGKVLIPTKNFVRTLTGARLAADVLGVPAVLVARTDSLAATLLTSDADEYDHEFLTGQRSPEGYFYVRCGMESSVKRALAYSPYADMLWLETSTPDLGEAKEFADEVHKKFPGKMLAYNCSPSFNWKKNLDDGTIAKFQQELGALGYKFQFITLAGWHLLNLHSFELAKGYMERGMSAYVETQEREFSREKDGYTATRHQREVGTGYFDEVLMTITGGESSTTALSGSTEAEQFRH